jgi:helix-turn-helix protein
MMLALAEFANDNNECWPSIALLSEMTGLKDRQVQNLLRELQNAGHIEIQTNHGRKNTNVYRFIMEEKVQSTAPFNGENDIAFDSEKVQSSTKKVQSSTKKVQWIAPDPIEPIDPIDNLSATQAALILPESTQQTSVGKNNGLTPQQEYFGALCWVIGWDHKTLTKTQSGQVAQTIGILQGASYTKNDLRSFWLDVWEKDWRWTKEHQRPTLSQVRAEIGKVKTVHVNGFSQDTSINKSISIVGELEK